MILDLVKPGKGVLRKFSVLGPELRSRNAD